MTQSAKANLFFSYSVLSNRLMLQKALSKIPVLHKLTEHPRKTMNEIYDLLDTFGLETCNGHIKLIDHSTDQRNYGSAGEQP